MARCPECGYPDRKDCLQWHEKAKALTADRDRLATENRGLREALDDSLCPECKGMPGEADGSCLKCVARLNMVADLYLAPTAAGDK